MSTLIIADHLISQDIHGRYRLNDLHAASPEVGNPAKKPSEWMRLDTTKALADELSGISRLDVISSVKGGSSPGTYACEELVVALKVKCLSCGEVIEMKERHVKEIKSTRGESHDES